MKAKLVREFLDESLSSFNIGDKVKLQDGLDDNGNPVFREYTITKPGLRKSGEYLKSGEVYLTSPGVIGFDASIEWLRDNMIKESVNESIEDKDWSRMSDLVLSGKDGAGVANTITNKKKAINRYVAGLKLQGDKPNYSPDWKEYSRTFSEFGNKALKLGATPEEIQKAFDEAEVPEKYSQKLNNLADKKLKNRFIGSLVKNILDAGFDIEFLPHNGNAITMEGREAMQRNGRKWTIGYISSVLLGEKRIILAFDAITDEGDGPTSYIIDHRSSDKIFRDIWGTMGKVKFITEVMKRLSQVTQ